MGICEVTLVVVLVGLVLVSGLYYYTIVDNRQEILRLERHLEDSHLARKRSLEQLEDAHLRHFEHMKEEGK